MGKGISARIKQSYQENNFLKRLFCVLKLASSVTVDKILRVESGDAKGQIILSLTLFFMRAHLTAINIKGSLSCKERISICVSSSMRVPKLAWSYGCHVPPVLSLVPGTYMYILPEIHC